MKRINLLPLHKQSELYYEDLYHATLVAAILGVAILLLGIVAQFSVAVYLQSKESSLVSQIETLKQQTDKTENAEQKLQIKLINSQMQDFEKLAKDSPQWSKVFASFSVLVPKGVKINTLDANAKTGLVRISGYSPTRESVIELYNNINSDKEHFKNINYPLENVSKPTDVLFNFAFNIQDGLLVPKP